MKINQFATVSLILLSGFALRLYRLGEDSLWYDETVSAYLAAQPIGDLIAHTARDIHPPGYYLLLHGWIGLVGSSEFALAYLSLMVGLLTLPLVYRLAHTLTGQRTLAAWAMAFVATAPFGLWYAQEVRMYTLGATLGLLTGYCLYQASHRVSPAVSTGSISTGSTSGWYWLGYLVTALAGLYSLYYFAFLLLGLNLLILTMLVYNSFTSTDNAITLSTTPQRLFINLLTTNSFIIVGYLPWLPIVWQQATTPPVPAWRSGEGWSLWQTTLEIWTALSFGQSVEAASVWPLLWLTLLVCGAGCFHLARRKPRSLLWLLGYSSVPIILINLFSLITPLYHVRYVFIYSLPFYIILAAGVMQLSTARGGLLPAIRYGLVVAIGGGCLFSFWQMHHQPTYAPDDYRAAVAHIEQGWQPDDLIMVNAGYVYPTVVYYFDGADLTRRRLVPYQADPTTLPQPLLLQTGSVDGDSQLGWGLPVSDFYAMSTAETVTALENLAHDWPRLWLLRAYDTVTDPDGVIRQWLADEATLLDDQPFRGSSHIRVQTYLFPTTPPPGHEAVDFADGLRLLAWHITPPIAGEVFVKLWWSAATPPTVDYKLSLKLWQPTGELAAQGQDVWAGGNLYRSTAWEIGQPVYQPTSLHLPPDLPPGRYWLNVELYHPQTIAPLPRTDGADAVVTLGAVDVP